MAAVASALWCGAAAFAEAPLPRVDVREVREERRVEVSVDGQPFTAYIWPERVNKPVLDPIRSARGTLVTRGWPLDPRPGERVDHPHHVGLWFNYGDVNGVDFWNNSDALHAAERPKMGTILHEAIVSAQTGGAEGELVMETPTGCMPGGKTVLHERTQFVFRGDARQPRTIERIDRRSTARDRRRFADNKDGMLGMRVARALEQPSNEPEVFTDAAGKPTAGAGAGQHRRHRRVHEQRREEGRRGVGNARPLDDARGQDRRRGRRRSR